MNIYIEKEYDIIHNTKVDFIVRPAIKSENIVHVVQYDKSLPIVKVRLYRNNEEYELPSNAEVKIRFGKPDHTFIYEDVLGCTEDRKAIYFYVDEQMVTRAGNISCVLELRINEEGHDKYANSSPILFFIDQNPIKEDYIESETKYPLVYELVGKINSHIQDIDNLKVTKQDLLIDGVTIKTINGKPILGSGNLIIDGGQVYWGNLLGDIQNQTDLINIFNTKQNTLISGTNIKTINNESILGEGNIIISKVAIKEINEADITQELLQEVYNEVPEILRINSVNDGIQDYELKVNDKNNNHISYTCIIGGIEIELELKNEDGTITFSTNALHFLPSKFVNNLYTSKEVDALLNNKQATLISGTNIKTINNQSILGSGNINVQAGGGVNLTPLEVENDYLDLLEFINNAENPETYTISNENDVHVYILKENTIEDLYVQKGCIISVYPQYSATILSTDGQYTYFIDREYLSGGVSMNYEEVESIINSKLGSDVVMVNTDQTISGQKKFTSSNGTIFENGGGTWFRYLYSSPAFKIIPDNNGNIDFYYSDTQLGRLNTGNVVLYSAIRPNLNESVNLGAPSYNWNNVYVKSLVSGQVTKNVSKLVTNDSNLIPEYNNLYSLGTSGFQWANLYLYNTLRFNPQSETKIENLKNLTVTTINLGGQIGTSPSWDSYKFLQYDTTSVKYKGKLYAGLDVNNQPIRNIPDTPDEGTSPINKNYADTNYVDLSSAQSINGVKTFNSQINFNSSINVIGNISDGTNSITVANIANKNNFITLTQAEYDALATKDPNTLYFIEEE